MIVFNAAIILCRVTEVKNNVFSSLRNQILCQSTEVSDYSGCFLHESVVKWHFGRILDYAGGRLERFDCTISLTIASDDVTQKTAWEGSTQSSSQGAYSLKWHFYWWNTLVSTRIASENLQLVTGRGIARYSFWWKLYQDGVLTRLRSISATIQGKSSRENQWISITRLAKVLAASKITVYKWS